MRPVRLPPSETSFPGHFVRGVGFVRKVDLIIADALAARPSLYIQVRG